MKNISKETCGIIMPISGSEFLYTEKHWINVKEILEEVISEADFVPNLVSNADETGVIHNRIVSNIYSNPIIICDVSSKNPNVMFELGLRLAFDKATILIKDNITNYNFDTSPIEHLIYPTNLETSLIIKFKSQLKQKLISTYKASSNPNYSTFLKNFVQYKPIIDVKEISSQDYVVKQLDQITKDISELGNKFTKRFDVEAKHFIDPSITRNLEKHFFDFLINNEKELDQKNPPPVVRVSRNTFSYF